MIEYLNGYTLAIGAAVLAVFAWWLLRAPKMPANTQLKRKDYEFPDEPRKLSEAQIEQARGMRNMTEEEMKAKALREGPLMAGSKLTPEEGRRMQNANAPEPVQKYDKFPEPKPMKTVGTREEKDGIPF